MNAVETIANQAGVTSMQAHQGLGALCYIARQALSVDNYRILESMVSLSDFENIECILAGNSVLRGSSQTVSIFGGEQSPFAWGAFISGSFNHIGLAPEQALSFLKILQTDDTAAIPATQIASILQ